MQHAFNFFLFFWSVKILLIGSAGNKIKKKKELLLTHHTGRAEIVMTLSIKEFFALTSYFLLSHNLDPCKCILMKIDDNNYDIEY